MRWVGWIARRCRSAPQAPGGGPTQGKASPRSPCHGIKFSVTNGSVVADPLPTKSIKVADGKMALA